MAEDKRREAMRRVLWAFIQAPPEGIEEQKAYPVPSTPDFSAKDASEAFKEAKEKFWIVKTTQGLKYMITDAGREAYDALEEA